MPYWWNYSIWATSEVIYESCSLVVTRRCSTRRLPCRSRGRLTSLRRTPANRIIERSTLVRTCWTRVWHTHTHSRTHIRTPLHTCTICNTWLRPCRNTCPIWSVQSFLIWDRGIWFDAACVRTVDVFITEWCYIRIFWQAEERIVRHTDQWWTITTYSICDTRIFPETDACVRTIE